jgi:LPXTG-motif cell wall-anchored protein
VAASRESGRRLHGWSSIDGTNWTQIAETVTNAGLDGARVGLYALGNSNQGQVSNTAVFDYFHVVGAEEPEEPVTVSATVAPAAPNGLADWYTQAVTVTVESQGGGTSTVYREYNLDGSGWLEYTHPVQVTTDGSHTVQYRASAPGSTSEIGSASFTIDATAPSASAALVVAGESRTVSITATDATSAVGTIEYRIGDGAWADYTAPVAVDGTAQTVHYLVTDVAGNPSSEGTLEVPAVPVDPADPTLTVEVSLDPATANGQGGWYTTGVTLTAVGTTTDEEGAATVEYSTDGITFAPLGASTVLTAEGETTVSVRATDGEGHYSATVQRLVKIDTVVPSATGSADSRTVTLAGTDATSGVSRVEYRLPADTADAWRSYTVPVVVAGTSAATVTYRAVDVAGNVSATGTVEVAETSQPEPVPTIVVDDRNVKQGELLEVTGTGFAPETEVSVWLYSEPVRIGIVTTDADGGFSYALLVPTGFEVGEHHVVLRIGDIELARSLAITVTAAAVDPGPGPGNPGGPTTGNPGGGNGSGSGSSGSGTGGLAHTGADAWQNLVPLAIILLVGGLGGLLLLNRRRADGTTE